MHYELDSPSQTDLEEIRMEIARYWSVNQVPKYDDTIFQEIEGICQNPDIGRSMHTMKELHRMHPVKPHIIDYMMEKHSIWIDRIGHKRMNTDTRPGKCSPCITGVITITAPQHQGVTDIHNVMEHNTNY